MCAAAAAFTGKWMGLWAYRSGVGEGERRLVDLTGIEPVTS